MKQSLKTIAIVSILCLAVPAAASASVKRVEVNDGYFAPANLTVKKKQKVTWAWLGYDAHTIIFDNGWRSPSNGHGATWSRIFKKKGTFNYYCAQHPGMLGKVKVR